MGTAESDIDLPIASVLDALLAKLDRYRAGNQVSERQWDDVTRLVKLSRVKLDWRNLESVAQEIRVNDQLDQLRAL